MAGAERSLHLHIEGCVAMGSNGLLIMVVNSAEISVCLMMS
jgi:hypothetical protein